MPTLPKKQPHRVYIKKQLRRPTSDQKLYNSKRWIKVRGIYKKIVGGICEACVYANTITLDSVKVDCDHAVPVDLGGAKFDFQNLNLLCKKHHNRKSGMEGHKKEPLIEYTENDNGDLIPVSKEVLWKLLTTE